VARCGKQLSGAQILVEALKREGVKVVFAYPGATSMLLHHSLLHSGIRVVLPRHEQGGAFAADGYARASGQVGVCIATSGPGATNLVTGISDACNDSIPLVAITCQVRQTLIGKNAFQETDIIGITRPCVKHSYLVLRAEELAQTVKDAFHIASHDRPGPVVIDVPVDVLQAECAADFPALPSPRLLESPPAVDSAALSQLLAWMRSCRRPVIYAGGGVIASGATQELLRFAERFLIPVTTSLMGIGAFPEEHVLSMKFVGMHGSYAANYAIHECDLLLALSVRFSDRVTGDIRHFAPMANIVHVDIDPSEVNKNKHADLAFICDAGDFLRALLSHRAFRCGQTEWLERIRAWEREKPFRQTAPLGGELTGQMVVSRIHELTRGKAVVVTGVGQHQMWSAQFYNFSSPRQFLTSGGLGAMGFGLPAAIGAAIAMGERPAGQHRRPVVLVDGDGAFQMNIQELAVLFAEKVPVKIVIINNQKLGMVAQWEERFFHGVHANTDLKVPAAARAYPDFCTIAKGYMIPAMEVHSADELIPALKKLLAARGPFLLDVHVSGNSQVLPMIPAGKTCEDIITDA